MTRYTSAAVLAFALGASAMPAPQWGDFNWGNWGSNQGGWPQPGDAQPSGAAPPAVPSAAPVEASAPAPSLPAASADVPTETEVAAVPTLTPSGNATVPAVVSTASGSATVSLSSSSSIATSAAAVAVGAASSGGDIPASSGTSVLSAVQTIAAGETFDGGMVAFDRGVSCGGQEEGGDSDAVFEIEDGGSLSNVIIGPNQVEGVHCYGSCTLTNVWWAAVCEDAFTIKEQEDGAVTTITGGGAYGAEDKVLQHNGGGTLSVSGFTVDDFGKLYRSCGNCDEMPTRHVIMDDITASSGKSLAGINSNYGDTATLTNIKVSDVGDICVTYTGNDTGDEPEENGSGPSDSCIYSESDVTEI